MGSGVLHFASVKRVPKAILWNESTSSIKHRERHWEQYAETPWWYFITLNLAFLWGVGTQNTSQGTDSIRQFTSHSLLAYTFIFQLELSKMGGGRTSSKFINRRDWNRCFMGLGSLVSRQHWKKSSSSNTQSCPLSCLVEMYSDHSHATFNLESMNIFVLIGLMFIIGQYTYKMNRVWDTQREWSPKNALLS